MDQSSIKFHPDCFSFVVPEVTVEELAQMLGGFMEGEALIRIGRELDSLDAPTKGRMFYDPETGEFINKEGKSNGSK